ncbi:MAG: hypothetical protein HY957_03910 [Nitrospirae bacterium]|nr:hypothetical protein [Nitrospirota bacterium]
MNGKKYTFKPLNKENIQDYLDVADNCSYSFAHDLEVSLLSKELDGKGDGGRIIIYETERKRPVAVFSGRMDKKKIGFTPFAFNVLNAPFGGILIDSGFVKEAALIRNFVLVNVFKEYYRNKLKIDYISLIVPPKLTIEEPSSIFKVLPFHSSMIDLNTILYAKLKDNILDELNSTTRYEIKKGLKNLSELKILNKSDSGFSEHFTCLMVMQADELGISPDSEISFANCVIASNCYHALVALENDEPLAAVIYSYRTGIATFSSNASSRKGKKLFVNKALLYTAMLDSMKLGAQYFVLGDGMEFVNNMPKVAFFKRSFSTNEVVNYRFIYPLSYMGYIATAIRNFGRLKKIQQAMNLHRKKETYD